MELTYLERQRAEKMKAAREAAAAERVRRMLVRPVLIDLKALMKAGTYLRRPPRSMFVPD